jgi:hypothetical protein
MFFALALALIAIAGGAVVTYLIDSDAPLVARLCMGACLGFAALGLFGFILASVLGFTPFALILTAVVVASPLLLLMDEKRRAEVSAQLQDSVQATRRAILHPTRRTNVYIIFYALVAVLIWLVFNRAMVELPDGIYTGVQNNYGDLPFHLSIITSFTDGANFPPEDPTYAGARFTYPFIADFVAACFVRAGATLRQAMLLENFVLALSFVGLLNRFTLKLTRDWLAGLIAPLLLLFSGGLGWVQLWKDARWDEKGLFGILMNLQQQYTITAETGYRWGNSLTTLLIPQRGILLGFPLAVIVFTVWWRAINEEKAEGGGQNAEGDKRKGESGRKAGSGKKQKAESPLVPSAFCLLPSALRLLPFGFSVQRMALAGAVAGLLPLVHAHSFVVVMMVGAGVALLTRLRDWRAWAAFFITATVIALPQMWWATHGSSVRAGDFFGWNFGWDKGKDENFFAFWFRNTGLLIPLILAALVWPDEKSEGQKFLVPRKLLLFYLPFTLCFIIPNLIKLAPWVWDNIKVIFYWFIASTPLVALFLARLLRRGAWLRATALVLLLTLTLAGALDVWSVASSAVEFRIFDADGVRFAQAVKAQTQPRSTILHEPTFDTPIFLTGRRSVMGYPGHISSHGLEYLERQSEIRRIYAGAPDAERLLAKYGVEYVVVGPHEQREAPVNEAFFARYQLVGETGEYKLYKIARP